MINLDELVDTLNVVNESSKEENTKVVDENFLQLSAGHTYTFRLLPNIHNPAKTFTSYEEYGFKSVDGGRYIYAGRTPHSVGKKDIIKDLQWATYSEAKKVGDEVGMKRSYELFPQQKQMVNVYMVDNTENPDLNGTVKILRYSAKTNKDKVPSSPIFGKIYDGIFGSDKSEIGKRAFDLSGDGVNFQIKVEKNAGGWNDYSKSSFKFPSSLGLTEERIAEIYKETKDLETFIPEVKSDEDLKSLLDVHWYGRVSENSTESSVLDMDDDIPMHNTSVSIPESKTVSEEMDSFLDGLDMLSNVD